MSPEVPPDPTGPIDTEREGCSYMLAAGFWVGCLFASFYLVVGVVSSVMIGDRCANQPSETLCGVEAIPVAAVISVVVATAITVGLMRGLR